MIALLSPARSGLLAVVATIFAFISSPTLAQGERRGGTPGQFDFFVLALSWSPGFCQAGGGDDKGRDQCRTGSGLGFVVHGLWPQFERGFPTQCQGPNVTPTRMAMDVARDVFVEEGLARYQWRKHGTCSGLSPGDYFAAVRTARDKVVVPADLQRPAAVTKSSARDLERAFVAANPGLRVDMMSVDCRGEVLQEVRVCMSRDLRSFVSCGEVDRRGCRAPAFTIPPAR